MNITVICSANRTVPYPGKWYPNDILILIYLESQCILNIGKDFYVASRHFNLMHNFLYFASEALADKMSSKKVASGMLFDCTII